MQRLVRNQTWRLTGIALLAATNAHADPVEGGGWHHSMHGWGGWFLGPVMMLIFLALLVGAAVLIARALATGGSGGSARTDRAAEILRERFAKGEITREEFDAMRKALN